MTAPHTTDDARHDAPLSILVAAHTIHSRRHLLPDEDTWEWALHLAHCLDTNRVLDRSIDRAHEGDGA